MGFFYSYHLTGTIQAYITAQVSTVMRLRIGEYMDHKIQTKSQNFQVSLASLAFLCQVLDSFFCLQDWYHRLQILSWHLIQKWMADSGFLMSFLLKMWLPGLEVFTTFTHMPSKVFWLLGHVPHESYMFHLWEQHATDLQSAKPLFSGFMSPFSQ